MDMALDHDRSLGRKEKGTAWELPRPLLRCGAEGPRLWVTIVLRTESAMSECSSDPQRGETSITLC